MHIIEQQTTSEIRTCQRSCQYWSIHLAQQVHCSLNSLLFWSTKIRRQKCTIGKWSKLYMNKDGWWATGHMLDETQYLQPSSLGTLKIRSLIALNTLWRKDLFRKFAQYFHLPHWSLFSGSTPCSLEYPQKLEKLKSLGGGKIAKQRKKLWSTSLGWMHFSDVLCCLLMRSYTTKRWNKGLKYQCGVCTLQKDRCNVGEAVLHHRDALCWSRQPFVNKDSKFSGIWVLFTGSKETPKPVLNYH